MNITTAKLIKHHTDDMLFEFYESTPLGKIYRIDLDTKQTAKFFNSVKKVFHNKEVVQDIEDGGLLPTECLEIIQ